MADPQIISTQAMCWMQSQFQVDDMVDHIRQISGLKIMDSTDVCANENQVHWVMALLRVLVTNFFHSQFYLEHLLRRQQFLESR